MTDAEIEPSDLSLGDVLTEASEGVAGVTRRDDGERSVWLIDGEPFATVRAGEAEFRLDPLVAGAALRTPDTSASDRGGEWVVFAPAVLDDAAVDRAEAWFLSAARRASGGGRPTNR